MGFSRGGSGRIGTAVFLSSSHRKYCCFHPGRSAEQRGRSPFQAVTECEREPDLPTLRLLVKLQGFDPPPLIFARILARHKFGRPYPGFPTRPSPTGNPEELFLRSHAPSEAQLLARPLRPD